MQTRSLFAAAVFATWISVDDVSALTLGPDTFGYTATDEVAFAFEDISTSSNAARHFADLDGFGGRFGDPLGFSFSFYGTTYDTIAFTSNGAIAFDTTTITSDNRSLTDPNPFAPLPDVHPYIAVLWDGWGTGSPGTDAVYLEVRGTPGEQRAIVQWNRIGGLPGELSAGLATFQAILFEGTNDLLFQYADVITDDLRNNGGSATVGIRNTNGTSTGKVLQWSLDSPVITDGLAILFSPNATSVTEPGSAVLLALGLLGLAGMRRRCT